MRFTAFGVVLALAVAIGLSTDQAAQGQRPRPNPQPRPGVRPPAGRPNPNTRPRPAQNTKMVTVMADYTLTFNAETGKVRTLLMPQEFSEKGEIKKYTNDEILKLKGDTAAEKKLPGIKAAFSDLQVNDVVQVALSSWSNEKPAAKKGTKGKKKEPEGSAPPADKAPKADSKEGHWVQVAALQGTVTKIEAAGSENKSPRVTIRVQSQVAQAVPAQPQPQPRPGQPVAPRPAQPPKAPAAKAPNNVTHTTVEPTKAQVTLLLIAQRGGGGK